MLIHGLQKMTMLDYPEHVACTVFLGGCDLCCPFCHNFELADGSAPAVMDDRELLAFLKKRQGLLDGVAVTGGEPCLRRDLPALLRQIKELGFLVKLDTNGFHPELLKTILAEKLADYVAVDIKNSPAKYALTAGVEAVDLARLKESIALLMAAGCDYEFRTTVIKEFHTDSDFPLIGELVKGAKKYYLQRFTDRDTVPFAGLHAPEKEVMERWRQIMSGYVESAFLRGVE